MSNVISEITLTNLAFNKNNGSTVPKEVTIRNILDDRYMVSIKIGDYETLISKEDLKRVVG